MGQLNWVATLNQASFNYVTGIIDFEIYATQGRVVLYAAGVAGNGLISFELIAGQGAGFIQQVALPTRTTLAPLDLTLITLSGGTSLWVEPWLQNGMRAYQLGSVGEIGTATQFSGVPALHSGLIYPASFADGAGGQVVYGGVWNGAGLVRLTLDAAGNITSGQDMTGTGAEDVAALATADLGTGTFLFSARYSNAAVTSWQVMSDGSLTETSSIGVADGIGIATPSALETVVFNGKTFLILTAFGSSSISVIGVAADGSLELLDHVIDSLDSRFGGVQAMAVVTHEGRVFVIAGGADDGISLFQMLPGGRLLHLQSLADQTNQTLNNVSAIEAVVIGGEIQIFVSGSEAGITQFSYQPDAVGVIQTHANRPGAGTGAADILMGDRGNVYLNGQGGNDILLDGPGQDRLAGGAGNDIFVLIPDNMTDTIMDYDPGADRIDLSQYPLLRNLGQIEITSTATGARFVYRGEVLIINSANGQPLAATDFTRAELLQATHVLPLGGLIGGQFLTGNRQADLLVGGAGDDRLVGRGGDDLLKGGGGSDLLKGGAGTDQLYGGQGADILQGGDGSDRLTANAGQDLLIGGRGNDILSGGGGDDVLEGDHGADQLKGGAGGDIMVGGDGSDRLKGGTGNDDLSGGNGNDRLNGGGGNDFLTGGKGRDRLTGGAGADTFLFQAGRDVIRDFTLSDDRLQLDSGLWTGTLSAADILSTYATSNGTDTLLDFGQGWWLRLDGIANPADLTGLIDIL